MSQRIIRDMIFGHGHPLATDELPDDIRGIKRADIAAFHESVIGNALPDIFLAGRITPAIEDAVNRRSANWRLRCPVRLNTLLRSLWVVVP